MRKALVLPVMLALAAPLAPARAALPDGPQWYSDPAVGAAWTQAWIPEPGGVVLHADVLRPAGLPAARKVPVILSVGPYFNHGGQVSTADVHHHADTTPAPSQRFEDFLVAGHVMKRGYAFVMVDLQGFGGSTGCSDGGGPHDQLDVRTAVRWAGTQPWSTGAVGLYGKSYDAVTGLIGEAQQDPHLKAVVAMEPLYSMVNYEWSHGVQAWPRTFFAGAYSAYMLNPAAAGDDPRYQSANTDSPLCGATYITENAGSAPGSPYWAARDFVAMSKGHRVPLLLTQGFLENNTIPEQAFDYFNELAGPKRAWFGMWDHIRGNETGEGLNDKPEPWTGEVMRWYDRYLRGGRGVTDPPIEVQSGDGRWRAEGQWPPADSALRPSQLRPGSYVDQLSVANGDGNIWGVGSHDIGLSSTPLASQGAALTSGYWTISRPFPYDAWYSGVPHVSLRAAPAGATMSVDTYVIDRAGKALLLSRTGGLVPSSGTVSWDLYGNDWVIPAGSRIGVRIGPADSGWYLPTPTASAVTVSQARISLPYLRHGRAAFFSGKRCSRLDYYLAVAPLQLDAATIASATDPGLAPPPPMGPPKRT